MAEAALTYELMSEEEYLRTEPESPVRREFVHGVVYAMAGGTVRHNDIAVNILTQLRLRVRATGCRAFGSDIKVRVPSGIHYYPDVSVGCGPQADTSYHNESPCLIVEVLSPGTALTDQREKLANYRTHPTVQAYWIVHQSQPRLDRHWRNDLGLWHHETLSEGEVPIPCIGGTLPLTAIYEGIEF